MIVGASLACGIRCSNCGSTLPCPTLGCPVVCSCGLRYSVEVDLPTLLEATAQLRRDVACLTEFAARVASAGAPPAAATGEEAEPSVLVGPRATR